MCRLDSDSDLELSGSRPPSSLPPAAPQPAWFMPPTELKCQLTALSRAPFPGAPPVIRQSKAQLTEQQASTVPPTPRPPSPVASGPGKRRLGPKTGVPGTPAVARRGLPGRPLQGRQPFHYFKPDDDAGRTPEPLLAPGSGGRRSAAAFPWQRAPLSFLGVPGGGRTVPTL